MDNLELSATLRQDWDDREQTNPLTGGTVNETFRKFQPKVALRWDVTGDHALYVSWGRGFRSGGFNAPSPLFPPLFPAEIAETAEVGFKSVWMDGRVRLNGAGFYTDNENKQIFQFDATTGTQGVYTLNEASIVGGEFDLTIIPFDGFDLMLGGGVMDTDIDDFNGTGAFDGGQIPLVYEWSYDVGAQYEQPLFGNISGFARLDYSAFGDLAWHFDNIDRSKRVDLVNLRFGLRTDKWSLTMFADNLTDERYHAEFHAAEYIGSFTDIGFPNKPQRFGVEASIRY